jgi:SAM-dependent methyltransferase
MFGIPYRSRSIRIDSSIPAISITPSVVGRRLPSRPLKMSLGMSRAMSREGTGCRAPRFQVPDSARGPRNYHRPMPDSSSPSPDRRSYWNERYLREPSRYGDEPNQFVVEILGLLSPRRILDAACGQGRNAVWLAHRGHDVTAVDISNVAIEQGRRLAEATGASVDFRVGDLLDWEAPNGGFDLVLLSYLQLPPEQRRSAHSRVRELLSPGGMVVVVAHHADNLEDGVGGPGHPEVLYREEDLAADFAGFEIDRNERVVRQVDRDDLQGEALDLVFVGRAALAPQSLPSDPGGQ